MQQDTLPMLNPRAGRSSSEQREPPCDVAGTTDVGLVRERNEDSFLVADLRRWMLIEQTSLPTGETDRLIGASQGRLLVVADGMGGHTAGDVASSVAVDAVAHYVMYVMPWLLRLDRAEESDEVMDELRASLRQCQQNLRDVVQRKGLHGRSPGTTLTMAYILWPRMYVLHAGDTRCYLRRDGQLTQLTTDHTLAQQLFDHHAIDREELARSPLRHTLINAVGGGSQDVLAEVHRVELCEGDTVLLCSDGLNGHVDDDELGHLLDRSGSSDDACQRMVEAAKAGGGSDNITVVVARY
jgi:PPM family protein phosphatase